MFKYFQFTPASDAHTTHTFKGEVGTAKTITLDGNIAAVSYEVAADVTALVTQQSPLIGVVEITKEAFSVIAQSTPQYARIKARVEEKYNNDVAAITSQYPLHERETWGIQLAQAKAYQASLNALDAPFLKVLADAEGDTVANFATAVIAKAQAYEAFMAGTLTLKRAYERELMSEIGL